MLSYLKEHTNTIHKEVEGVNLAKHILDHSITLQDYKRLLFQNYLAYNAIELALTNYKSNLPAKLNLFVNHNKSNKLLKDLAFFNLNLKNEKALEFEIKSLSEAIAAMYVMEGSMLGGLMIGKHLKACEHLKPIENHSFFGNEAKESMLIWKQFKTLISTMTFNKVEKEHALEKAKEAFLLFKIEAEEAIPLKTSF